MKLLFLTLISISLSLNHLNAQTNIMIDPSALATPIVNGQWLQPAQGTKSQPIWGFKDGIRIGIAPLPGPRGLIRIYTPYLNHDNLVVTNFIAIEPIVEEHRGLSELEHSKLDNQRGKRFWSGNTATPPKFPDWHYPVQGVITNEDGVERLSIYIFCEKFDNGADVYIKVCFTEGKLYEFEISAYNNPKSKNIKKCILTATMGNKARLRTLHLADGKTKQAGDIWTEYTGSDFTPHDFTPTSDIIKDSNGGIYFISSPNEEDPSKATYELDTHEHWKYQGLKATQYWYCKDPSADLVGSVNGRYTYWASKSPIPGGISFENFELLESFTSGQKYIFGISPETPESFIDKID